MFSSVNPYLWVVCTSAPILTSVQLGYLCHRVCAPLRHAGPGSQQSGEWFSITILGIPAEGDETQ